MELVATLPDEVRALVDRIQSEYEEMPGLRLTSAQAQRLFGLGAGDCGSVMTTLVETGFLTRTRNGAYVSTTATR